MFRFLAPLTTGLVLAAGLSQFPEFSQQYTQRVGGAYFELRDVAEGFRTDAANNGKTVSGAIAEYRAAGSKFLLDRGDNMLRILTREGYLRRHYQALSDGDGFTQLLVFAKDRDNKIARQTLAIYKPAVPLTMAGLAHAALGFLIWFLLLRVAGRVFRRRRSSRV